MVFVAGVGAGVYGVCLHPVLPLAVVHWAGEVDDGDVYDSAVWGVVGGVVAGGAVVDGAFVWGGVDWGGVVVGVAGGEIISPLIASGHLVTQ